MTYAHFYRAVSVASAVAALAAMFAVQIMSVVGVAL